MSMPNVLLMSGLQSLVTNGIAKRTVLATVAKVATVVVVDLLLQKDGTLNLDLASQSLMGG